MKRLWFALSRARAILTSKASKALMMVTAGAYLHRAWIDGDKLWLCAWCALIGAMVAVEWATE